MRVESVHNVYRPDPLGVRVIQWITKESNNKHYYESRVYTVHLYSREGKLQEYTNQQNIDVYA